MYKEVGQKHCDICGICIRKAAHHCQLLGNHIGDNNQIIFFLYVLFFSLVYQRNGEPICVSEPVTLTKLKINIKRECCIGREVRPFGRL